MSLRDEEPIRRRRLPHFPILNGIWKPLFHVGFLVKLFLGAAFGMLVFFVMSFWLLLAWLAVLMFFAMQSFEATLGGDDRLDEWEEIDLHGGFFHLIWAAWMFMLSSLPGGFLLAATGAFHDPEGPVVSLVLLGSIVLFFPIFLLSGFLNEMSFFPFSPAIVRSLIARRFSWIVFYLVTVLGCFGTSHAVALLNLQLQELDDSAILAARLITGSVMSLLSVLWIFFYFRLLGRLAWILEDWSRTEDAEEEDDWDDDW